MPFTVMLSAANGRRGSSRTPENQMGRGARSRRVCMEHSVCSRPARPLSQLWLLASENTSTPAPMAAWTYSGCTLNSG